MEGGFVCKERELNASTRTFIARCPVLAEANAALRIDRSSHEDRIVGMGLVTVSAWVPESW